MGEVLIFYDTSAWVALTVLRPPDSSSSAKRLILCAHITTSHMPNITLAVPEELHRKMRAHPEIRWSEVVRRILSKNLEDLERMEAIAKHSTLTARDVDELAHLVNEGMRRRLERARKAARR